MQLTPLSLAPAPPGTPTLAPLEPGCHRFLGPVVYRRDWQVTGRRRGQPTRVFAQAFSVLDLGLQVGCWDSSHLRLPAAAEAGSWWAGELRLRVDGTSPRFESLPGVPALAYQWRIERILLDETPLTKLRTRDGGRCVGKDKSRESYREVPATNRWAFGRSDYRMECTLLGGPRQSRLPPASPEERQAALALVGDALTLTLPESSEPGRGREPWTTRATVVQVSVDEPRRQRALLRLGLPLLYEGSAYPYAVAYLRYEGEGLGRLAATGQLFCSVKGLPVERAESAAPFDRHQWPVGAPIAAELRRH